MICETLRDVRSGRLAGWLAVLFLVAPLAAAVQRGAGAGFNPRFGQLANVPYDGRFTFVRARYQRYGGWRADYPVMERNLMTILKDITTMEPHVGGSNVHDFDDPELFRYPTAYFSEPGYWFPTDGEVRGLREYLQKGGFLIVDDFHFEDEWAVFQAAMRRVLPAAQIRPLDRSHPIFNTFFEIACSTCRIPAASANRG
jgi:hypothetical protein